MASRFRAPDPPRSPWQLLLAGAHRARLAWYRRRRRFLPRPVVSVGNLHWGGSGKTPLVAAIAAYLRDRGHRVAILSRGYRSEGRGVRVVSAGAGPLLGPRRAGDEPVLLAGELPGVGVVVGPDRFEAGRHALERLDPAPDLLLLDDGFSHLGLARDLDLLALPAADPFGGGRLPPSGRLREPLAAAARADAVLVTSAPDAAAGAEVADALRRYGFSGPGFSSRTAALPARLLTGEELPRGTRVVLVAAIARPGAFRATAEEQGFEIAEFVSFPDHHAYPERSLAALRETCERSGAECLLTTSKDRVKLLGRVEIPLAEVPIRAEPEAAFWHWLESELEAALGRRAPGGAPFPGATPR